MLRCPREKERARESVLRERRASERAIEKHAHTEVHEKESDNAHTRARRGSVCPLYIYGHSRKLSEGERESCRPE